MEKPVRRLRWLRAPRWPGARQMLVALLLGALGFAAVTQIREQTDEDPYGALREQDLLDLLVALDGAQKRGAKEVSDVEDRNDDLTAEISDAQERAENLLQQIEQLEILAGAVPVRGAGIRITIAPDDPGPLVLPLIMALSDLRLNGAEAIEVNNSVRLTMDSAIEDVGEGLTFAGQDVEPPYVIEAIGPPVLLADAMDFAGALRSDVQAAGGQIRIEQRQNILIPSLADAPDIDVATPQR